MRFSELLCSIKNKLSFTEHVDIAAESKSQLCAFVVELLGDLKSAITLQAIENSCQSFANSPRFVVTQ